MADEPGRDSGTTDAAVVDDASVSAPDAAGPADSGQSTEDDAGATEPDASTIEDASTSVLDAGPPDAAMADAGACFIGAACNPWQECDGDDRCYGNEGNGFCAPFAPECGGLLKTECAPGLTCIRAGGSSLGYCADWHERYCICRSADVNGFTTDGCV